MECFLRACILETVFKNFKIEILTCFQFFEALSFYLENPFFLFSLYRFVKWYNKPKSWLYTYRFSCFDMFVRHFVRLRTNLYTLLTISPISFIFDSARNLTRNLPYRPLWCFMKIPLAFWERWNAIWEKWLARWFTKCHLYTSRFSHFTNIFSCSHQFDDKHIAG